MSDLRNKILVFSFLFLLTGCNAPAGNSEMRPKIGFDENGKAILIYEYKASSVRSRVYYRIFNEASTAWSAFSNAIEDTSLPDEIKSEILNDTGAYTINPDALFYSYFVPGSDIKDITTSIYVNRLYDVNLSHIFTIRWNGSGFEGILLHSEYMP